MSKIHYILPMAGRGSRFAKQGFDFPKPLIEIYEKPFFYWAVRSIEKFCDLVSLDFVILQEHVDKFNIDKKILSYFPNAKLHILPEVTAGAVITSLKGCENIDDTYPVLFNDCDHLFKCTDFNKFSKQKNSEIDGVLLTFEANENKYSFVGKDEFGNIIKTVEKQVISNEAICGCYYFKNAETFRKSANEYLKSCEYSEFFMSGVYNVMIKNKLKIKSLKTDFHVSFGVPEEYELAKTSTNYLELL